MLKITFLFIFSDQEIVFYSVLYAKILKFSFHACVHFLKILS